ncbi:hypothetical protein FGIG_10350 [Fasciola gigantica]|uniref:Uncharacterized protein n=1 Tax=Fasciola gigantica TaxID=46835 RepID=A0A504YS98_FASGI|nr:hypothetical protein FGIG_10350 [Fasciola gigantica]
MQDLFFHFPCNSFLHATCECLIRLIVLRAILNSTCSAASLDPSPSNTVSFSSTDAFHQQFFTPNECSPKSGDADMDAVPEKPLDYLPNEPRLDQSAAPEQKTNVFWLFLNRVRPQLSNTVYKGFPVFVTCETSALF